MNVLYLFLPMIAFDAKMSFRTGRVLCEPAACGASEGRSPTPRFRYRRCGEEVDARMRVACAGMTAKEARAGRTARTKPPGEMPAISVTPCRQWTAPLAPGSSQPPRLSRSDPHCFHCFSHCSLHCFPLFLRRRVSSRSFKVLHCNWRQFSIADRLYFCAGAHCA